MKRTRKLVAWIVVIAMLLSGCGSSVSAEKESSAARMALADRIAATIVAQDTVTDWMVFDLAVYARMKAAQGAEGFPTLSDAQRTAYINSAVASITREGAAVTDFAKAEIILSALGEDTNKLTDSDGNNVSNPQNFASITEFATYSDAVWALIADSLGSVTLTETQIVAAVAKLSESVSESGMLFGSYGGYTYDDPDSTGAAIGALAKISDETDLFDARALFDKMLVALSAAQQENGSLGSACTDAFVIIGLCAAGINPETDSRFVKGENSLVDGLMSYAIEGGFAGYDGSLDLEWSTEQGMRALMALQGYETSDGAYNLYYSVQSSDNDGEEEGSENEIEDETEQKPGSTEGGLVAGGGDKNENENQEPTAPENGSESEEDNADSVAAVTFEMRTHKKTWISAHTVRIEENTSVKNLIAKIFDEYGVESEGLSSGYLRSVTYNGETWGEFDAGGASGWQYYVNGELPRVGISSYKLKRGDHVELVYTADYTASGNEGVSDSESDEEAEVTEDVSESDEEKGIVWKNPFTDVSESDWFIGAVEFVNSHGLMNGMTENTFEPQTTLTRAMFVTVLYRMEGSPDAGEESFDDVQSGDWFANAVAWASEREIVNGTDEDSFSPTVAVTREQMATLAYRYAKHKGDVSSDGSNDFTDSSNISEYAKVAAAWANSSGVMTGSDGVFRPRSESKRCEAAAVFMRLYNLLSK